MWKILFKKQRETQTRVVQLSQVGVPDLLDANVWTYDLMNLLLFKYKFITKHLNVSASSSEVLLCSRECISFESIKYMIVF